MTAQPLGPDLPPGRSARSIAGELRACPVEWPRDDRVFLRLVGFLNALTLSEQERLAGLWRQYQEELLA